MHGREHEATLRAARRIADAFDACLIRVGDAPRSARAHFEGRQWLAEQHDSARRLDLYSASVTEALEGITALLGDRIRERSAWPGIRARYAALIAGRDDAAVAETFFNSVTRRVFHTVGVDASVEFVAARLDPDPTDDGVAVRFEPRGSLAALMRDVLAHFSFAIPWDDLEGDAERAASRLTTDRIGAEVRALEMARPVFFRGKGAYLVGRIQTDAGATVPLVLALTNPEGRVVVDAVLTDENEVSIVFSFARAYFAVEADPPGRLVAFLRTIMPRKPVSELYNAIGWNKHGKTELYRSILRHLETTDDRFEVAPGQLGMVMCVFTLPRLDVVFKVIRDRFDPPKTVTHAEVAQKYRLVFHHDRAGRLVDAQEFEHLAFDRDRFAPELRDMLARLASERVEIGPDKVVLHHLYTERRLRPLDVHLREAPAQAAVEAVVDYGQALKDLAATNIFPGDMLLKNFGVSRHGRLIFYDYDELCLLSECVFRRLPASRDGGDQGGDEPSFYVGERDIFPEEFRWFLGLTGEPLAAFLAAHADLLEVGFWQRMQDMHRRGEVADIYPYKPARRLDREGATR